MQRRKILSDDDLLDTNKESRSLNEKKMSRFNIDEEDKLNDSDLSIYNMSLNQNNESQTDHINIQSNQLNHPYRDVNY